jgi:hypothetical protein
MTPAKVRDDDEAQRKADDEKAAAAKAAAEGQIPDEQLQKDPRFQALDKFQKEHQADL